MLSFYQMCDQLNGKPYENVPPPPSYEFMDYVQTLTNSPVNGVGGTHELKPLQPEDMARYSADDVVAHYKELHKGKNPLGLGKPMTDEEFKKFCGITW